MDIRRLFRFWPFTKADRLLARRRRGDQATTAGDRGLLLIKRLEDAGIDPGYVHTAMPDLFGKLAHTCRNCDGKAQCSVDAAGDQFNERAVAYCPNTERIDALILKK